MAGVISMTGASGRQRVQEDCFTFFLVNTPPNGIQQHFAEMVRPFFNEIQILSQQLGFLTKTRDLLLPRLISGKLSVADLDIQFPPGMVEVLKKAESAHALASEKARK